LNFVVLFYFPIIGIYFILSSIPPYFHLHISVNKGFDNITELNFVVTEAGAIYQKILSHFDFFYLNFLFQYPTDNRVELRKEEEK